MSWFSNIFGNGVAKTVESVGDVAKIFVGDKSEREQAQHLDNMATKGQFASEFQYRGKTDWVDKWNRLPRPMLVTTVLLFFPCSIYMIFKYPAEYQLLINALAVIPNGAWLLLSTIVTFYFGGRMQIKSQDFNVNQPSMDRFVDAIDLYKKEKEIQESPEVTEHETGDK